MILVDSGYWIALASKKDKFHERAKSVLNELDTLLVTTWPVITETCYALLARGGPSAASSFLKILDNGFYQVFPLNQKHSGRLAQVMDKYSDLPMDLADASLVIMAEELHQARILTTDRRDFSVYRWGNNQCFDNVLLPD